MAISLPLVAKIFAGVTAVAAPVTTGVVYREEIKSLLVSKTENNSNLKSTTEKDPTTIITQLGITDQATRENDGHWKLDLTSENLQKLKLFEGNESNTIETLDTGKTVKLKIEKTSEEFFPEGFKFTLISENDTAVKIKKTANDSEPSITLSKGKGVEFKLKGSTNNYSLEKLVSEEEMKSNLNLNCESGNDCTIQTDKKINVKDGESKKIENVVFKEDQTDAKIKFEKYKKDYKDGFRFYVDSDIELKKDGETGTLDPSKLESGSSYEAIKDGDKWFLSKKS